MPAIVSLKCPNCNTPLHLQEKAYICDNQHQFDIAKEGYINLLLAQRKRSRNPGDNKEMMLCRRQFLEAGHYDFLIDAIAELIKKHPTMTHQANLIDIGCAEGYYAHTLKERLHSSTSSNSPLNIFGIDIAKDGVKLAAKRKSFAQLSVSSAYDLPFFNNSFEYALSVFSPLAFDEAARILKPSGLLITVGPAPNHLQGLAEKIYTSFKPHKNIFSENPHPQFQQINTQTIEHNSVIYGKHIYPLLTMTPYYWSCSPEQQAQFKEMDALDTLVAFKVQAYRYCSTLEP